VSIAWNTGAVSSTGGTNVASGSITIPAMVNAGDVLLIAVAGFNPGSATETLQASSTGTAPVIVGTQQRTSLTSIEFYGAVFSVTAAAGEAGKVITASFVSGDTANWALALGAWSGASGASPIDVSGGTSAAFNDGSPITCPSEITGVAGDWCIQLMAAALGGSSYTGGSPFTQRESVSDASSGATAAIFDSNGSVGGSGTTIGGATFANAGHNSWWTAFTVGLAPAPAPVVTSQQQQGGGMSMMKRRLLYADL
jgi:hypothetical protein